MYEIQGFQDSLCVGCQRRWLMQAGDKAAMQQSWQTCMSKIAGAPQGWPGSTCHEVSPPDRTLAEIPLLPDLSKRKQDLSMNASMTINCSLTQLLVHGTTVPLISWHGALHADKVKEAGAHHMCWRGSGPMVICLTMSAGLRSAEQGDLQQCHSEITVLAYADCAMIRHWEVLYLALTSA